MAEIVMEVKKMIMLRKLDIVEAQQKIVGKALVGHFRRNTC